MKATAGPRRSVAFGNLGSESEMPASTPATSGPEWRPAEDERVASGSQGTDEGSLEDVGRSLSGKCVLPQVPEDEVQDQDGAEGRADGGASSMSELWAQEEDEGSLPAEYGQAGRSKFRHLRDSVELTRSKTPVGMSIDSLPQQDGVATAQD